MELRHAPRDAAQAAAILRQRAAVLARRAPAPRDDLAQVLEFAVAEQSVAVELACVREVRLYRPFAPLPLPQPFVTGIVGLHGRMLPVLDLALVLGLPATAAPPRHFVVLGAERAAFAVPAGEVHGVRAIALADAARRAASLSEGRGELVAGITPDARLVLDPRRLLALSPAN